MCARRVVSTEHGVLPYNYLFFLHFIVSCPALFRRPSGKNTGANAELTSIWHIIHQLNLNFSSFFRYFSAG